MKKTRPKVRSDELVGIGIPATKFPSYEPMMTAYIWSDEDDVEVTSRDVKVA